MRRSRGEMTRLLYDRLPIWNGGTPGEPAENLALALERTRHTISAQLVLMELRGIAKRVGAGKDTRWCRLPATREQVEQW